MNLDLIQAFTLLSVCEVECRCSMLFWHPCQIDRGSNWQCSIDPITL